MVQNCVNKMKASNIEKAKKFEDIPNVGQRVASDLKTLGFKTPLDLKNFEAFSMYQKLCKKTKVRHDPCLLDVFLAIEDFVKKERSRKWFHYTKDRKKLYPNICR